jgi:hypothetical protein
MEITKLHKCKNIWLNTTDTTIANGGTDSTRRIFRFNELPLIQIKKKSYLKVNSLTLSGAGHQNATNNNWIVKLHGVNYNQFSYYNSDKNGNPTIVQFNFDTKYTIQNGLFSLELEPQDIVNFELEVYNEAGEGLVKSALPIDIHLNLLIEEYEDEY